MPVKSERTVLMMMHPSAEHAANVVDRVVYEVTGERAVFVGLQEEGHSPRSLHYGVPGDLRMRAFDVRTHAWSKEQRKRIDAELIRRLPKAEYDLVWENLAKPTEHLHVEADPKPVEAAGAEFRA